MAYTVLARRYRSTTFDEVVGQGQVAQTLKRAIESGRIAHAYLFCGTRGVGKTSMARILAKALNCQASDGPTATPCGKCESCLAIARGEDMDVIEIDAASNTGVDNVRDIIENSQYRPAHSRFKVYIIDEVHMLSKSAFNALLKTLEEPPGHVKFILATTEPEKVLPTILSRCQRYDFRNIPTREIAGHLKDICKQEKIRADDDALLLIAKAGAGSMRDSLSLLDRLLSVGEKELTLEMIEQLLGLPKSQLVFDFAEGIGTGDVRGTLTRADAMIQSGMSPDALLGALVEHLRNLLILRTCGPDSGLVEVPGLALKDLAAQADRFDSVFLTQDIAILEELRRHLRQAQAGRALLDATLVRLTLAEQFAGIGEILNGDGTVPTRAAAPAATPAPAAAAVQKKKPEVAGQETETRDVRPVPPAPSPVAPAAPTPVPASSADDEDDDLPRPGKVWEAPAGPSLSELLRQQAAASSPVAPKPAPAAPVSSGQSNVEAVDPSDLPGVWQAVLRLFQDRASIHPLLAPAELVSVDDGQAIVRYSSRHETFVKMLDRNGKKDQLREALSKIFGRPVGVTFETVAAEESAPAATPPAPTNGSPAPSRMAARPTPASAPQEAPPIPAAPRLTDEMKRALRDADPLVAAAVEQLGAEIIKVD